MHDLNFIVLIQITHTHYATTRKKTPPTHQLPSHASFGFIFHHIYCSYYRFIIDEGNAVISEVFETQLHLRPDEAGDVKGEGGIVGTEGTSCQ
jgi:hypothetical protein